MFAVFNVTPLIRLTGSSPGPAGRVVLPPPVHTGACQGDRPETARSTFPLFTEHVRQTEDGTKDSNISVKILFCTIIFSIN